MQVSLTHTLTRINQAHRYRIRHKRCDEAKPICETCLRTGRICDGYIDPQTRQRFGGHADRISPVLDLAPRAIFSNETEAQGFRFYEQVTNLQLGDALRRHGWAPPLLQLSHQNPAICHAVAACGILSKRYQVNELSTAWDAEANELHEKALQQYGKAVVGLRSQLSSSLGGQTSLVEYAPACCFLLIVFEFLQGNAEGLLLHLNGANKLLASAASSGNPLVQSFSNLLAMIDMIVVSWLSLDNFHIHVPLEVIPEIGLCEMPFAPCCNFTSLFFDLVIIQNNFSMWRRSAASVFESTEPDSNFRALCASRKESLDRKLEFWNQEFITFCASEHDIPAYRLSLLRANYLYVTLNMESIFKQYLPEQQPESTSDLHVKKLRFSEIIDLTESALASGYPFSQYDEVSWEDRLEANGLLPIFSFRQSFIHPLYFVARKAPDLGLRQRAIEVLLQRPWREGAWDSFAMGSIAKRSIEVSLLE